MQKNLKGTKSFSNQSAPSFDQLFELNELKAQSQEKDIVITILKEIIKSLSGNMNEDKVKKDIEEIETINIELDHRLDFRKKHFCNIALKDELKKLKGKALVDNAVTKHYYSSQICLRDDREPITPELTRAKELDLLSQSHPQETQSLEMDIRQKDEKRSQKQQNRARERNEREEKTKSKPKVKKSTGSKSSQSQPQKSHDQT
ncbi:hypothetical protein Tco_0993732 [Tanacetum coccineum]